MSWSDDELRAAYRDLMAAPVAPCPDAAALERLLLGTASAAERQALADHLERCGRCAAFLQELRSLADWSVRASPASPRPGRWRTASVAWPTALAAGLLLSLGGALLWSPLVPPAAEVAVDRTAERGLVTSALGDREPLPRGAFALAWTSEPPAERYTVEVLDSHLRLIHRAAGLSEPRCTVPARAFGELPPGETIYWRVEAIRGSGERVASSTFVQRLR